MERLAEDVYLAGEALAGRPGHDVGWALLAALYRQVVGGPMPAPAVTPRGKPWLPGSPWQISITHTPRHAFCALAPWPVGLDAEELDRAVAPGLAKKILSPGEYAQFLAAPDPRLALLKFWVLKESQAKCTGLGLTGQMNQTRFTLDDPRLFVRDGCLLALITEKEEPHAL